MKKEARLTAENDDMRPEYDFSGGVRGKYYEKYRRGSNVVLLDPDVAQAFPTTKSVNTALRSLAAAKAVVVAKRRSKGIVVRPRSKSKLSRPALRRARRAR